MPRVPLFMTADVVSAISVSPASLMLGDVKPGEPIEKRLLVKSREPFQVTGARCEGFEVTVVGGTESKTLQAISVKLTPRSDAATTGQKNLPLIIETNLPGNPQVTTTVVANIVTGG